jgi:hypothetical protein
MGTITTLRPSSTSSGVGWTPSTGTLHGVTSDNSDATYATWGGSGSALILGTPVDSPPAGERRHQVRLRMRGEDGDAWGAVRLSSGALAAGVAAQFPASPATVTGSWGFGAPPDGSTILYTYVTGQTTGVRIEELYLDVDSREAPTFTPQIQDGSGAITTTISDTAQPTVRASSVDLDDLGARQYRYWVTLNGATVWDTGIVSGTATGRQTSPLDNGSYVAHLQVWSTLGQNTAYASDEETLAFTVQVGQVAKPENPTVLPVEGSPFYDIQACAPFVEGLDGGVGYVEVQRVDCPVGGYLETTGGAGSYASAPDPGLSVSAARVSGDFDSDVSGWAPTGGTLAWSNAFTHEGHGSALLTVAGSPVQTYFRPDGVGNSAVVVPGRTYRTTFWLYAPVAIASVTAAIDWFDAGVGYLSGVYESSSIGAGTWTFFEAEGVAPVGAAYGNYGPTIIDVDGTEVYATQITFEDITGPADLEVTVVAGRDDGWRMDPGTFQTLVAHWNQDDGQHGWHLVLASDGLVALTWSQDGTANTGAASTVPVRVDPFGVVRLRALLDTDTGAGDWAVTFQTQDTDEDPWVQLGEVVTGPGPAPLFNSPEDYTVGAYVHGSAIVERWAGRIYSAEIRSAPGGEIMLSPDFTNHLDGTTEFEDAQGNPWTVHSPARIYSPTSTHTVAMLGPLASDECASWVDYTLPRSGVGITCDHAPVSCCSYYRARTVGRVDGDLRISDWSDVYDAGLPAGLIVMWAAPLADLPDGWNRVTELDGKYPKGVASAATQPGTTGGAATHSHTLPTHTHDTSHSHTVTGATGTATGTFNSSDGAVGNTVALNSHTHTRPATNSATVTSGATTPGSGTASNDPARAEVVFIESDGSPLGVPPEGLALTLDIPLSGWDDSTLANTGGRYLKGRPAGLDGGLTAASSVASHTHTIDAHTHTGTSHGHTSSNTGVFNSNRSVFAGPTTGMWSISHSHPISVGSSTSAALNSGGSGSSGTSPQLNPPFRQLRLRENVSGGVSLPVGLICLWRGSLGSIPDDWKLCDGTEGTPDMFGLYPRVTTDTAVVGDTGGSLDPHTHTSPDHTHTTGTHLHSETIGSAGASTAALSNTSAVTIVTGTHTHSAGNTDNATPPVANSTSGTLASTTTEPPYEEVAFVQLVNEPEPPPDPDVFCLEWSEDEHLIRTNGPDGPMWAPVLGKFEWAVTRPFTAATGVMGSRFVTSAAPGGRDLTMTAAVESEAELARLRAVLARPLVLISPSDASEVWAAPVQESVRIVKVGRIRQVTASFIGTGPEPAPQLADVGV